MKTSMAVIASLLFFSNLIMDSKVNSDAIEGILYLDEEQVIITSSEGVISKIEPITKEKSDRKTYIAPGLIDLQINGYMGVDFSGPDLTLEGIRKATKALWQAGVTTYYPTIITSDFSRMKENFTVLAKAMNDPEIGKSIPGFHLEGPYISPLKGFRGAHLEKYIKNPDWKEFQELQKAANNGIKIITLAPELEGAIPFIRNCVKSGVLVSLGHHNGNAEQIKLAIDAGAKMATHLGNG